jgi:cytochrome c-type biogenesis protein CcmH
MSDERVSRRRMVGGLLSALPILAGAVAAQEPGPKPQATPRAGQGEVGELFNPDVAGRPRTPTLAGDNDAAIRAVELKLGCTCGCTLDIFTCRTTDFTCTYSPAMHREVVALAEQGKTEQEIIDAFVDKYGEKVLMAPKPEGFNLAGYVVPGVAITVVGGLVAWVLRRRVSRRPPGDPPGPPSVGAAGSTGANAVDLERLERALKEIDA